MQVTAVDSIEAEDYSSGQNDYLPFFSGGLFIDKVKNFRNDFSWRAYF